MPFVLIITSPIWGALSVFIARRAGFVAFGIVDFVFIGFWFSLI